MLFFHKKISYIDHSSSMDNNQLMYFLKLTKISKYQVFKYVNIIIYLTGGKFIHFK